MSTPDSLLKKENTKSVESISKVQLIIVVSDVGDIQYVSSTCEALLGYARADLINTRLENWINSEDLYLIESLIYQPSHQTHCYFRMKRKDGTLVWMEAVLSEVKSSTGEEKEIVLMLSRTSDYQNSTIQDRGTSIAMPTSQRRKNEDLQIDEDYSAYDLIEYLPNGVFIFVDGIIKYVNEAGTSMLGACHKEQILETSVYEYIEENYHEIVEKRIKSVQQGYRVGQMEQRWKRFDGRAIDVEITSNHTTFKGKPASFVMLVDISHRKSFHKILQNSRERFRKLVQNSIDTIGVICEEKWTFINESGLKMLEVDNYGEIFGKSIYDNLPKEDFEKIWQAVHEQHNGMKLPTFEQEWKTMKGNAIHTELVGIPTTYLGKDAMQIIIRDITERKQAEALMLQSEKLTVAGQLAAGIAHEIRNPLTAIKGFFKLLEREMQEKKEYFHIIESELSRIELILSELLLLAKPHQVYVHPVSVHSLLKDVTTLLETQAIMNNVWFDLKLKANTSTIKCDENQMKQVFINLIKNGIEAMPSGGTIYIDTEDAGDEVMVTFRDEGTGISEDIIKRLGEPFFTTKTTGTGLGLMITFNIIKNHHGTVNVTSEVNEGTQIEVRFQKA
ncbi:PAS domain S-box protein [Sutcliffiella horikoshii]|uniref:histidine kinase n=1 Tax=Sutcliffiella horikoshii TaxID=79883 RepID=A0AA94WUU9_9BACI|nr:PAS domain-containing sensor histidine kinase [Sutcliffiella horikoshii]TYS61275.1 PAS domain S-box protein [Sutcliffiella horikoshii]